MEIWFGILSRRLLKRGNFSSTADLKNKVLEFIDCFNTTMANAFKWMYKQKPFDGVARCGTSAAMILNKLGN